VASQPHRIKNGLAVGTTEVINASGKVVASAVSTLDTDDITEGSSKLYYTTTRVDTHLADSGSAKTINNTTIDCGTF
jgi:hypothetical protein